MTSTLHCFDNRCQFHPNTHSTETLERQFDISIYRVLTSMLLHSRLLLESNFKQAICMNYHVKFPTRQIALFALQVGKVTVDLSIEMSQFSRLVVNCSYLLTGHVQRKLVKRKLQFSLHILYSMLVSNLEVNEDEYTQQDTYILQLNANFKRYNEYF